MTRQALLDEAVSKAFNKAYGSDHGVRHYQRALQKMPKWLATDIRSYFDKLSSKEKV